MVYYKVIHKHNLFDKIEKRRIGIFTTLELAEDAVNKLKKEIGFKQTSDGFKIVKIHRLFKPNYLDIIFYKKGFDTHKNDKKKTVVVRQSFAEKLLKRFDFLFKDYGFKLEKIDLGNAIDENGKFFFYGPVYCYYIYNDDVCINILNLVQRQDYNIYITKNKSDDQTYIRKGVSVEGEYAYNIGLFATYIKASIESTGEIYGFKIN